MTPNRREFEKQCAFQKFCKSVLHNEACNAHEEIRRRRVREVTFSDLALHLQYFFSYSSFDFSSISHTASSWQIAFSFYNFLFLES